MDRKGLKIIGLSILILLVLSPSMTQAVPQTEEVVSVFSPGQQTRVQTIGALPDDRELLFGPLPYKADLGVTQLVISNTGGEANTVQLIANAGPFESAAHCQSVDSAKLMMLLRLAPGETLAIPMAQPWRVSAPPLGRISVASDSWCLIAQANQSVIINIAAYETP